MIVGFIKGFYIIRYETNSSFGFRYDITDGTHIFKTVFSNDMNTPLKIVSTLANCNGFEIKQLLIG